MLELAVAAFLGDFQLAVLLEPIEDVADLGWLGVASLRMQQFLQGCREERPHLPCGHPLPQAGEELA